MNIMKGISIIIPVFNKLEITQQCVNNIRAGGPQCVYEIIIVDNGSTDGTQEIFSKDNGIVYLRNQGNLGISKACNSAAGSAKFNVLCFMHNDVVVFEKDWICRLRDFILQTSNAGVVGLYGAKTMRRDGSFRGKTIVHSKGGASSITGPFERVAVVDGLLLAVGKTVFEKIGGFSEDFSIHYYDKDISLRSLDKGFMNYIINMRFEHRCGSTRKDIKDENLIRVEAQKKFIEIWSGSLPADASTWREKLTYLFKMQLVC